jgi:uncharacterized damage-inducible protein DinB
MPDLTSTAQKLRRVQQSMLAIADTIHPAEWTTPPAPGCWSAAHIVSHLCVVERGTLAYADRVIRKTPLPVSFFKRFHLPIALVELRLIKRKAPKIVAPAELSSKETMLAELRGVRERTLSFLEETHSRDLRAYVWPHPFLGPLNFYQWFTFVAAHQARHTKQLVALSKNLPNHVANSQK